MVNRIARPNDLIRSLILRYLYTRNASATSARGKRGAAVKISDIRRDLKEQHGLARGEVVANLRYLISQGWVEEQSRDRVVPTNGGRQIPSVTIYYAITAAGIDKIEGPSEYTPRDRFAGIVINATGRNTVTVGDGNQVNLKYEAPAEALASLSDAVKHCDELDPERQMDVIADIDTIQSQLARSEPKSMVIQSAWESIKPLSEIALLAKLVLQVGQQIGQFLN